MISAGLSTVWLVKKEYKLCKNALNPLILGRCLVFVVKKFSFRIYLYTTLLKTNTNVVMYSSVFSVFCVSFLFVCLFFDSP